MTIPVDVKLTDFKGDYWHLILGAIDIRKATGRYYCHWYVVEGPPSLTTPPYVYELISTPIFTEWWT